MIHIISINFLLAIATTIAMTILPLLTTEKLGLSVFVYGMIEGGSELLSNIFRLVSGSLFDRIKNKKYIFISATIVAFFSKIILFTSSAFGILGSKVLERLSNGLFGAPRDAFVGQATKNKGIGLALLSCSKTLGCVSGPLLVSGLVYFAGGLESQIFKIILVATAMAAISIVLSFFLKTKSFTMEESTKSFLLSRVSKIAKRLSPVLLIAFLFFLGRFNDGMIILYLKSQGLPEWFYLSTIGFFNLTMFIVSPVIGILIDNSKVKFVLYLTILSLISFNIFSYLVPYHHMLFSSLSLVAWGVQRVGAQITFTALIFKNISSRFYGTAIGIYSILSGLGNFISSSICGHLAGINYEYVFLFSGSFGLICLLCSASFARKIL